jgi:hypothetical protein
MSLHPTTVPFYEQLLLPLAEAGRDDLVNVIRQKLKGYHRSQQTARLKESVKKIDENYFQGRLVALKRSMSGKNRVKPK